MGHRFELPQHAVVDASPERVWEAMATGPGWDSWFIGRNSVEPRQGGQASFTVGEWTQTSRVETWDPPRRFVTQSEPGPDGSFHRFDYALEPRGGGTEIKYVHSGMLGDDWEAEYEGMSEGDPAYFRKLLEYVEHFSGRFAVPVNVVGPKTSNRADAMRTYRRALGVPEDAGLGDRVTIRPEGLAAVDGVVDEATPSFLGVRGADAMYRFIYGFDGATYLNHHLFGEGVDPGREESAWRGWLGRVFAG